MPGPATLQTVPTVTRARKNILWAIAVVLVLVGAAIMSGYAAQQKQAIRMAEQPIYVSTKPQDWIHEPPPPQPVPEKPVTPVQALTPGVGFPSPAPRPAPQVKQVKPPVQKKERKSLVLVEAEKQNGTDTKNPFVLDTPTWALPSPYTVLAGNVIPAALITGIMSDLPGGIKAQVTANVYDSVTQSLLLIPQGSTVLGAYNHEVNEGQERVLIVWNRLIFPDGRSKSLGEMDGVDTEGYAGFHDLVDTHFWQMAGKALVMSAISTGTSIAQNGTSGQSWNSSYNSPGSIAAAELGLEMGRTSNEILRRGLSRAPTITVRPGFVAEILIKKDLVFDGVYK